MAIRTYIWIITLSVNGLNTPTKKHIQTESEGMEISHVNGNQKKAWVAILTSDKIDFKIKPIIRDKEGHYIMIKG